METDQLFLMDCYIKNIKVYYDKLPFYDSEKWLSRTHVNFNLFEHSKLEVQESEFSVKSASSSLALNKGASCLFGLRDEQLAELCRNLGVTVIVSDQVKGINEKVVLASKNIVLPLSSTDLIEGTVQDSNTNETRINEFFICDKSGQVITHMSGFLRVTFLGRRVVTHFYFSKTLNDILYRTAGNGESSAQSIHTTVSQAEMMKQITQNLRSQEKETADVEIWKMDPESEGSRTKDMEKTFLANAKAGRKDEIKLEDGQNRERSNRANHSMEKYRHLGAEIPSPQENVRGAKIAEQLNIEGIIGSNSEKPDNDAEEARCICPFISSTRRAENYEAKECVGEFRRLTEPAFIKTSAVVSTDEESVNQQSNNEKDDHGSPQIHGTVFPPCPCLMGDQLTRFLSCPCINKESKLAHVSDSPASDTGKARTEFQSCFGEGKKEIHEKNINEISPEMEYNSCPCKSNPVKGLESESEEPLIKRLGAKLFSCECMLQRLDRVVKPMALFANVVAKIPMDKENPCNYINPYIVYSCTCMINRGFHFGQTQDKNCSCANTPSILEKEPQSQDQTRMCSSLNLVKLLTSPDIRDAKDEKAKQQSQMDKYENSESRQIKDPISKIGESNKRMDGSLDHEENTTNVETRIKQLLNDDLNIFIPENAITGNSPVKKADETRTKGGGSLRLPPILVPENIRHLLPISENLSHSIVCSEDKHLMGPASPCSEGQRSTQPVSESQRNPLPHEVQTQKKIPVIELPFDSQTDVYLLKISRRKHERNQTDKKGLPKPVEQQKKTPDEKKHLQPPHRRENSRGSTRATTAKSY